MKRGLLLLLSLVMLFAAQPYARAEETAEAPAELAADLYDLLDYGGESAAWVASAVPISDGILLAPITVKDIPADQLAVSDGDRQCETVAVIPDENNRFAVVFYDPGDAPSKREIWQLLPMGDSVSASSCTVRFGDSLGSRINRGVLAAEEIRWQGQRCYLLSLTEPAPAGSPVLTPDNQLAGIVMAQWAEGINAVLVLPAEGIAEGVTSVAGLLAGMPDWADVPEGLDVQIKGNLVKVDWHEMVLPETKAGEQVYMVLVDTGNNYLTSYPADSEERILIEQLTPGRFYIIGPVVSAGRPAEVPVSYASVYLPQAEPLTDYHFKPIITAVAEAPEGGLKEGPPVPVTEVTEELLRSGRAYFYSQSSYEVDGTIADLPLLVTLTDPEGNNYRYETGWVYSPDYMAEDIWYISLKDARLTESLDENGYPAGIYEMAFYVNGELGDSFAFELK